MGSNITIDISDFVKGLGRLDNVMKQVKTRGIRDVASEILRLSTFEVPHDKGLLQASGHVEDLDDESIVGYNKVYAARLHEHPEYRFQKGRKGKYLEDPIKNNLHVFIQYFKDAMSGGLK
jgi:hypothetical protein